MTNARTLWIKEDPASQKLFELAERVAPAGSPILITGESGTGKKYLSRIIHQLGPRKGPYLLVECGDLPEQVYEADLFGGDFAGEGAGAQQPGAFELASEGTVVLDEVASLSAPAQALLANILEDHRFKRNGGKETVNTHARVIALSSVDIGKAVKEGRLKEELFYRLDITKIWVPPLRERPADIVPLAEEFLHRAARHHGKPVPQLNDDAKTALKNYRWPGNVRELRNTVERAFLSAPNGSLGAQDLPANLKGGSRNGDSAIRPLEDVERDAIVATLEATQYQIGRSAQMLGISRKTLLEKRKKFGLK